MAGHSEVAPATLEPTGKRLDSWKEIAAYVNRHVTTVRRWEKQEGLPVHRHLHAKLGSIYAYARELDTWLRQPSEGGGRPRPARITRVAGLARAPSGSPIPRSAGRITNPARRARCRTSIARKQWRPGARRAPAAGPPGRRAGHRKEPARDGIRAVGPPNAPPCSSAAAIAKRSCLSRRSSPCFNGSSG